MANIGFDPGAFAAGAAMGGNLDNTILGMFRGGAGQINGGANADQAPGIGDRLLSGLQSNQEGYENFEAQASKAKALRAVIKAYAQDEPDPDKQAAIIAQSHTAGLGELEGIVQEHAQALAQQKQKADIAEQLARGKYYQAFGDAREDQAQSDTVAGQFVQNYLTAPKEVDPDTGDTAEMAPDDRMRYAAKNTPGLKASHMPKIMDSLSKWQQIQDAQDNGGMKPQEMTTPDGTRVIYNKKTGAFTTPDKGEEELIATKPKDEDIPDGYLSMQVGKGWQIKPDPSRWATRVEPDPENPLAQIYRQILLPKPGAPGAAGGGTGPNVGAEAATGYKSPQDVRQAVASGKLTKEQAVGILQKQFGMR